MKNVIDILPKEILTRRPCFFYNIDNIVSKARYLVKELQNIVKVFYCLKANHDPCVVRTVLDAGLGIEVSSLEECKFAISLGANPDNIIITGPGKTKTDLSFYANYSPHLIILESIREVGILESLLPKGFSQNILLRINPKHHVFPQDINNAGFAWFGGEANKFGIDEEHSVSALSRLAASSKLRLCGIHVFAASGILNANDLLNHYEYVCSLRDKLEESVDLKLEIIDFGGGLGIDHNGKRHLDIEELVRGTKYLFESFRSPTQLLMELGTWLVADSGSFFAEIVDTKSSRSTNYIILNSGLHHMLRPALLRNHSIRFYSETGERLAYSQKQKGTVVGNLCHPLDVFSENINIPSIPLKNMIGATVEIQNTGAYCQSLAAKDFTLREEPETVYCQDGVYSS